MTEGTYLGFDFSLSKIGIAVGQSITLSARPLETISAKKGVPDWRQIIKIIECYHPRGLVVGLPTDLDGKELYTTGLAKTFSEVLATHSKLPVYLSDERLTTVEAKARLFEEGGFRKISGRHVDSVAACIILEQWLRATFNE